MLGYGRMLALVAAAALCGCTDKDDPADGTSKPADVTDTDTDTDTDTPVTTSGPAPVVTVDPVTGIRSLHAHVSGVDGPVTWSWTVDGEASPIAADTVPATEVFPDQEWTATATVPSTGATASASVTVPRPPGGNVLVIVLDDLGLDKFNASGIAVPAQITPNLDRLAQTGTYFTNAYATPLCSSTRGALMTGRHARRTGIGALVGGASTDALSLDAITLPEMVATSHLATYYSFAAGKYHLASGNSDQGNLGPTLQGFAWYAGSNDNLPLDADGYFHWKKVNEGVADWTDKYATTDTIDDAIAQIDAAPEPWFAYVGLNAPHEPFHIPPAELTTIDLDETAGDPFLYGSMLEAADTEIGRLLYAIGAERLAETTIVLLGDNGTPIPAIVAPFDPERAKHSVYDGGVHVPLVVSGPVATAGGRTDALVHVVDVFTTIADIVGAPIDDTEAGLAFPLPDGGERALDGVSLLPWLTDASLPGPREYVIAETFSPNGPPPYHSDDRTIRDDRWKLMITYNDYEGEIIEFFDMDSSDIDEGRDLLTTGVPLNAEQQAAFDRLSAELPAQIAALPYEGF